MKKVEILIMAFMLCLTVTSCVKKSEEEEVSVINIEGHRVVTDDDFPMLNISRQIGDCFFTRLLGMDDLCYYGELKNDTLYSKRTFLPKGEGPMEYRDVSFVNVGDSLLVVMNCAGMTPHSFDFYRLENLKRDGDINPERLALDFSKLSTFRGYGNSFVTLTDSTILINSGTLTKGGIFSILNLNTTELQELDWHPDDGFDGNPVVRQGVYVDNSWMYKNGKDIFYLSGNGMFAMIFRIEDYKLVPRKVLFETYPNYWAMEDDMNYLQKLTTNDLDACANDKGIYILERDRDMNFEIVTDERTVRSRGNIVHYYDWQGNNKWDYKLDQYVVMITVSADNKSLYGYQNKDGVEDDIIYEFKLSVNSEE